ncbi:MAG: CDP-alcohol phosphatidyltransferase family protein, partial [Firmicutes bacterium]|nr:CDP-alcohol phosphatidyltransferase family protein [Bacillota bacterium]
LITATRFVFAALILFTEPFSVQFWIWYLCGGLSDLLDGHIARKYSGPSPFGAKLDSAADLAFIICVGVAVFTGIAFPLWVFAAAGVVALVRVATYTVGYLRFRAFATLHTWLNKATGLLLLLFPVLFTLLGVSAATWILCGIALLAALEELWIMARSETPDRDCKGIWMRGKTKKQAG